MCSTTIVRHRLFVPRTDAASSISLASPSRFIHHSTVSLVTLLSVSPCRHAAGLEGEKCLPCPAGGVCPGDERFKDLVRSQAGFWRLNATVDPPSEAAQLFCQEERKLIVIAARDGTCPVLQPCEPVDSCLGNNTCKYGYVGERCSQCLPGKFYRVNGEVRPFGRASSSWFCARLSVLLVRMRCLLTVTPRPSLFAEHLPVFCACSASSARTTCTCCTAVWPSC